MSIFSYAQFVYKIGRTFCALWIKKAHNLYNFFGVAVPVSVSGALRSMISKSRSSREGAFRGSLFDYTILCAVKTETNARRTGKTHSLENCAHADFAKISNLILFKIAKARNSGQKCILLYTKSVH